MDAALQIEGALRAAIAGYGALRVGIVLGPAPPASTKTHPPTARWNRTARGRPDYDYRPLDLASPASFLADWLGVAGPAYTLSTACTSGARALLTARRLLARGAADAVIGGGVDTLCPLTINGSAALEALSSGLCNPLLRASRRRSHIGREAPPCS